MTSPTAECEAFLAMSTVTIIPSSTPPLQLHTRHFPCPKPSTNTILFLTGWNESCIKYWELYRDLNDAGFNVYTLDHRSQGLSDRDSINPTSAATNMSYVTDFQLYTDDVIVYIKAQISSTDTLSLVAHSMGGLITLNTAAQYPKLFDCVVVCAPMICFKTAPWPWSVTGALTGLFVSLGLGLKHAIGFPKPNWEPHHKTLPFECSHSSKRNITWTQQIFDNPVVSLSGPSNQWVRSSFLACDKFLQSFVANASANKFPLPYMMVRAGKDRFVHEASIDEFLLAQPHCSKTVSFPSAFHEVFVEEDEVRDVAVKEVIKFVKAHAGGKKHGSASDVYKTVISGTDSTPAGKENEKKSSSTGLVAATIVVGAVAIFYSYQLR